MSGSRSTVVVWAVVAEVLLAALVVLGGLSPSLGAALATVGPRVVLVAGLVLTALSAISLFAPVPRGGRVVLAVSLAGVAGGVAVLGFGALNDSDASGVAILLLAVAVAMAALAAALPRRAMTCSLA